MSIPFFFCNSGSIESRFVMAFLRYSFCEVRVAGFDSDGLLWVFVLWARPWVVSSNLSEC